MRRVKVMKWKLEPLTPGSAWHKSEKIEDFEATFHMFGQETDEDGAQTVAIVEHDDGFVDVVPSHMIRFLDKESNDVASSD